MALVARDERVEVERGKQPRARLAHDEIPPRALRELRGNALGLGLVREEVLREATVRSEPAERELLLRAERHEDPRVGHGAREAMRDEAKVARGRMRKRLGGDHQRARAALRAQLGNRGGKLRRGIGKRAVG